MIPDAVPVNPLLHKEEDAEAFKRLMTYYECAIMEVETKLRVFDAEFSLRHDRNPIESISCRLKSVESMVEKLNRKGHPLTVESVEEHLYDVAGVRVVCTLPEDVYMLECALSAQDDISIFRTRDYIKKPKESGYRSLHLVVDIPIFLEREKRSMKVEVQLRSIAMNFWAALDHQLQYKKALTPEAEAAVTEELRALADDAADLDARMERLRQYLFGE